MKRLRIQVLLDDKVLTPTVRDALQTIDAEVQLAPLDSIDLAPASKPADARLVLTKDARGVTNGRLEALGTWFDRDPCATLVLSDKPFDEQLEPIETTPDRPIDFAANLSPDALSGRLRSMCVLSGSLGAMRRELNLLKRRDEALMTDVRHLHDQLELAGAVQRDLLRSARPEVDGVNVRIVNHAAEEVSGDICDLVRIDESRVALLLADATGHGLGAGLLTVFIKQSLRGQMRSGCASGRLEPDEVLARLSDDILEANIQECHFATAIHAVYDERTQIIRWARGGAPYPILVRPSQAPRQITSAGSILGTGKPACRGRDERFEVVSLQLRPGDLLLFHTDGLDALLTSPQTNLGCSELHRTGWFRTLSDGPIEHHLAALREQLATTPDDAWRMDDLSVVAIEVCDPPPHERGTAYEKEVVHYGSRNQQSGILNPQYAAG